MVDKSNSRSDSDSLVKVAIRCRPMSEKEIQNGYESVVQFEGGKRVVVEEPREITAGQQVNSGRKDSNRDKSLSHVYDFNAVFDCNSSQKDVYESICAPIVESVLRGYNGTIFAYGQTGTGKTYTMEGGEKTSVPYGDSKNSNGIQQLDYGEKAGIIPRAFKQIFEFIARNQDVQFLVRASYLEIYQEEIHDLLKKDRTVKLEIHERPDVGFYVKDLTSFACKSVQEIEKVMRVGNRNRRVGATDMNERSSRSHAIFIITVEQQCHSQKTDITKPKNVNRKTEVGGTIKLGKLNLVDLAGSERQRKTKSSGERQRESIKINQSLAVLGNVINALMKLSIQKKQQQSATDNSKAIPNFIPYRDSKLTRLLQDSLGGNSKTLMIANIGPASYNYDETINTLNYASRAKCIRNKPRINEDPKDALLRELQNEIESMRTKLAEMSKNEQQKETNGSKSLDPPGKDQKRDPESVAVQKELMELRQKLASLEGKLLNGKTIMNDDVSNFDQTLLQGYTRQQELELEKRRTELAKQTDRENSIRSKLEEREEAELMAKESFGSIQAEIDAKKKLIKQILLKTKSMRDEIEDMQKSYGLELEELDQLQFVLQKELKLKRLVMDSFLPSTHIQLLMKHIVFDERRNCCSFDPIWPQMNDEWNSENTGNCLLNDRTIEFDDYWRPSDGFSIRPRSEFERISSIICPENIRYKYENLIEPKLEVSTISKSKGRLILASNPELVGSNSKKDGSSMSSSSPSISLQDIIDESLNEHEPDIVIE